MMIPLSTMEKSGERDDTLGYGDIGRPLVMLFSIPAGFFIGDKIGKNIYINWQEFDLKKN